MLICSAHCANCAASSSGTPAIPQITCTGYTDVIDATRSACPSGAISSSRLSMIGPTSVSSQRSSCDARNAFATRLRYGAVLGTVHREDEVAHELADVLGVDRRRERVGVAEHGLDVLVAHDLVARGSARTSPSGSRPRGTGGSRLGPLAVRLAVQPVGGQARLPRRGVVWSAISTSRVRCVAGDTPDRVPDTVVRYRPSRRSPIAPMFPHGQGQGRREAGEGAWARRTIAKPALLGAAVLAIVHVRAQRLTLLHATSRDRTSTTG